MLWTDRRPGDRTGGDPIAAARQSVGEAITRIKSLPEGHPLRESLPQLSMWHGELNAYGRMARPTEQMKADAERYRRSAEQIATRAQSAAAELSRPAAPDVADPRDVAPGGGQSEEVVAPTAADRIPDPQSIIRTLEGWAAALERRNLDAHMNYYADNLHTFYLQRGVNSAQVRADRAGALARYSSLDFQIRDVEVRFDPSGKRAVATFEKRWNFKGDQPSSGTVQERVWLTNVGGRWRITGERDLRVYATSN
jgi:ketosteroid isomerase-like protein